MNYLYDKDPIQKYLSKQSDKDSAKVWLHKHEATYRATLLPNELSAIASYAGQDHQHINPCAINSCIDVGLNKIINGLSSAISKAVLCEDVIVYRGISNITSGLHKPYGGFSSTSLLFDTALHFVTGCTDEPWLPLKNGSSQFPIHHGVILKATLKKGVKH